MWLIGEVILTIPLTLILHIKRLILCPIFKLVGSDKSLLFVELSWTGFSLKNNIYLLIELLLWYLLPGTKKILWLIKKAQDKWYLLAKVIAAELWSSWLLRHYGNTKAGGFAQSINCLLCKLNDVSLDLEPMLKAELKAAGAWSG